MLNLGDVEEGVKDTSERDLIVGSPTKN